MRQLALQARRSPVKWIIVFLIILNIFFLYYRDRTWIGIWPRGSCAAQLGVVYLGPIFFGVAAWVSSRSARDGVTSAELPIARSSIYRNVVELAPTLLAALLVYTAAYAAVVASNLTSGGAAGFVWPSYYLIGLSLLVSETAVGHVVGVLSSGTRWASPIGALLCFGFNVSLASRFDLLVLDGDAWLRLSVAGVLFRCALALVLVTIAAICPRSVSGFSLHWSFGRARKSRWAAMVAALSAFALMCVALAMSGSVQSVRAAPDHMLCTAPNPKICLWPEDRIYLARIQSMHRGMARLPQLGFKSPSSVYETGLSAPEDQHFSTRGGAIWGASNELAIIVASKTYPGDCVPSGEAASQRFTQANFNVLAYLTRTIYGSEQPSNEYGGPPVDKSEISKVVRSSHKSQKSWLVQQERAMHQPPCRNE